MTRLRAGLSVYGTTYSMGLAPRAGRAAITAVELLERAESLGLSGVELPAAMAAAAPEGELRGQAEQRGLFLTVDTAGFDPDALGGTLALADQVGAGTVRTVIGGARIGGDRRPLAGRWRPFVEQVRDQLTAAVRLAEAAGVTLTVENHQDLASEELLELCEHIDSPRFGLTLDTGNPLATVEEPVDFFRRVAPYVRNVHLKDYWTWLTDEGYCLVRCPLGAGLTDFPALLEILDQAAPEVSMAVELGALQARHIRVLAEDFWPDYPPRSPARLAAALRTVHNHARPEGDWRTPAERDEPVEAIVDYEQQQLRQSLDYLRTLPAMQR